MRQLTLLTHLRPPTDDVIIVTALPSELPVALPETLLFTGVGKINASYVLTRYLTNHPQVKTVINYGTAGGAIGVKQGDLIKCTTFVQGDMDCGDLTSGPGITFGDDPAVAGVIDFGTDGLVCRTQDHFVTDLKALDLFQHIMYDKSFNCVDMEAYALAKVCANMGKNFICYKYISDGADDNSDTDWQENVAKGEPLFYDVLKAEHKFTHVQ